VLQLINKKILDFLDSVCESNEVNLILRYAMHWEKSI